MKRKVKRITAILLSLSTALSCAANVSAREVSLGQTVNFPTVPYINPGAGDSSETIDRLYNEARGNASTSSYDMNGMRDGYKIPDGGWDWADWINSDAWKNPVKNQSPMGNPTSPNGSMPDELSNPNAAHDALSSNMPTIPNTKKGLEGLIDGMSGGKQTGVMSLEDFMKLIGDQNQAIKDKYDKLIEEAKKKQKGDAASAKDIQQKFDDAQNGKNPWTGQTNPPRPSQNDWLDKEFEDWKDENNIPDEPEDVGNGSENGDDDDPLPDIDSEIAWLQKSVYRDAVEGGFHAEVPKEPVSQEEARNMRLIRNGQTVDAEGNPTGCAAELVAEGSDKYTYFYTDKNGKLVSETKDFLIDRYGSVEAAEKALGPLKPASDYLSGGKTISDLSPEERAAFRRAGLAIKDEDGKYITPAQAMKKYGSYDKMPSSVQDSFDNNGYLRNSLNKMYGEDVPYLASMKDFFEGFEDADFSSGDFPEYPSFSELTEENKEMFESLGVPYDDMKAFVEDNGGMENLSLEDVRSFVLDAEKETGSGKRKIFNTDDNFFEDPTIIGYGNLGTMLFQARGDYDNLPALIRQRMTKSEFERIITEVNPIDLETITADQINWTPVRTSMMGQASWDSSDSLTDYWYMCPECGGFFNTKYACGCGIFNDAEWLEAVNAWDRSIPFGHLGDKSGGALGNFLAFLDAHMANSYISDKLPSKLFAKEMRKNLDLGMNPLSQVTVFAEMDSTYGHNGFSTFNEELEEDGLPSSLAKTRHQFPILDDRTGFHTDSTGKMWAVYNPCRIVYDSDVESEVNDMLGNGLDDIEDPEALRDKIIDLGLDDDLDDLMDWLNDQIGGDDGDNGKKESEEQSKKFDEESEKQSRAQSENIAKLESEKQAALERYRKQIESEYQKYRDSLPKPDDELPEDPSLWTDDDYDEAIRQMNEADQQASGQPKFDDSKIPKIGDTKEYSETDLKKLVEELFGDWPENKGGMKKLYDWLVAKYGDSADSKFLETLKAMYEAGVFNTDDPDMVRKNLRAFINGYNSVTDEKGNFAGFVKIYTTASAAYKDIGVKKNTQKVCGNQRYEITYEKPSEVSATHLTGGDHVWAAGPQTGTYTAVGKYEEYNVYYTLGQATVTIEQYAEVFGIKVPIRSRTEVVVLEDESGIKQDNRVEKQFYGPETIVVKPGNIDMNKTDFFNTQRIR